MIGRVIGIVWAVIITFILPLQALVTRRLLESQRPTPLQAYRSTIRGLALLGLITLAVDWAGTRAGIHAAMAALPWSACALWTIGALAVCVAVTLLAFLYRKLRKQPLEAAIVALLPRTREEHLMFLGVSLMAGIVEEYVMRGFCLGVLATTLHSAGWAYVLVTLSFGLAHGYQGATSMIRATALGAVLGVPVLATGALGPSVLAHAGMDIAAGLWTLPVLRRMGLME
jgi:CAAX protease family protein